MSTQSRLSSADNAWLLALNHALNRYDCVVSPRGMKVREVMGFTSVIDMEEPVVTIRERALSYRLMTGEAVWILSGDDSLAGVVQYNKRMAEFSDDGTTLFGAYGPRVAEQLGYVVNALTMDRDTRQAVMTLWRKNPMPSKDIPCTVALVFQIRQNHLHCHVFMRSSDVWLGLPYDIFAFTMIAAKVACYYNDGIDTPVEMGLLHVTAASSHLYDTHWEAARALVGDLPSVRSFDTMPQDLIRNGDWAALTESMKICRDATPSNLDMAEPKWLIRPYG